MLASPQPGRYAPELSFAASVALRFDAPRSIGETPEGVRFHFTVQGSVQGPLLEGKFPPCAAYLVIDQDGIGTINVRAPLLLRDGALAELEAMGRYDFGADGYRRAAAADLPNSALGWCPRFLTGDPRYQWLNRALHVGVGELRPREARVDYDLFVLGVGGAPGTPGASSSGASSSGVSSSGVSWAQAPASVAHGSSLYDRLGGQASVRAIARDFVDTLLGNIRLNRQNRKVAVAHSHVRGERRQAAIQLSADMLCKLVGGPCDYSITRSLRDTHVHLDITEADWALMRIDLEQVLIRNGIGQPERGEVMAIIEKTKPEIVK